MQSTVTLEKIMSLCKRKGFVYQTAELYGGLNGLYDFGHLGSLLRNNIRTTWLESVYQADDNIFLLEGALLAPEAVWHASGHLEHFHDPMVDCTNCKHRYRADEVNTAKPCPTCGKSIWTEPRDFNMMFQTQVGASQEGASIGYLRPETAQSIFLNFKNITSTNRVKLPFGIAQIGKAFRNEINPKHFLFRMREFEQMELEWFCKAERAQEFFALWSQQQLAYHKFIGITPAKLRLQSHDPQELAHYAQATSDIEYEFPFGWKELEGIVHRGNFDLAQHSAASGKELAIFDEKTQTSHTPNIIECSVGIDRLFLTLLFDAYEEQDLEGEQRTVLHFSPRIAPIKAAFLPLVKKLNEPIYKLFTTIRQKGYSIIFDDGGSIGKRYRRQDEIGTPLCFTYDFDSVKDSSVTARDRDTMQQERISIDQVERYIAKTLEKKE